MNNLSIQKNQKNLNTTVNFQTLDGKIDQILNIQVEVSKKLSRHDEDILQLKEDMHYVKNKLPLESWQQKIIKSKANESVRSCLGNLYGNGSMRNIAYRMFYNKLRPFGYLTLDRTERQFFEGIQQAMLTLSISKDNVIARYHEKREEEELAKQALLSIEG